MTTQKIAYGTVFFFLIMTSLADAQVFNWGENVGPVSAIIVVSDSARGLPVYSLPQKDSSIVGYVRSGVVVRAYNDFRKGWVKLRTPIDQGWVQIEALQPYPAYEALATSVNQDSLCLPIRKLPNSSAEEIACGQIGQVLPLTGVMTTTGWLQLRDGSGWVDSSQVLLQPITQTAAAERQSTALGPESGTESPEASQPSAPNEPAMTESSGHFRTGQAQPERKAEEKQVETQIGCNDSYCVAVSADGRDRFFNNDQEITQKECNGESACTAIFVSQLLRFRQEKGETQPVQVTAPNKQQFAVNASGAILDRNGEEVAACAVETGTVNAVCLQGFLAKNTMASSGQIAQPAMPE